MIAQAFRLYEITVFRHVKDYEQFNTFQPDNGGSEGSLTTELERSMCLKHRHGCESVVRFFCAIREHSPLRK
ncbi:Uncharacterised protein [Budvicia aquatica]|uniref:Uncharacterized protein n=1 Tax=Budvicia aquatica TaxID=82979 RepID=A0A484ZP67_9GAMM|nr:Uncharacterised protein [Budvicia aquatica]